MMRLWRRHNGTIRTRIVAACLCGVIGVQGAWAQDTAGAAQGQSGASIAPLAAPPQTSVPQATNTPTQILPVLVFDRDRIVTESQFGVAFEADIERERSALVQENNDIYAALEVEEAELSALRPTLSEEAFLQKADAFDQKVTSVRAAQDRKAADIQSLYDTGLEVVEQRMNAALTSVAREVRAMVVFERQQVYMMSGAIDVSSEVIRRLDAQFVLEKAAEQDGDAEQGNTTGQNGAGTTDSPSGATTPATE
ncbi:OmpH family outer membrane protein [Celeribacter sp.]|uniref:OmpH family outer membrane protein n=1 Tax=Celeribacter sp. TaxID=1890673 RepID=UPI003A914D6C